MAQVDGGSAKRKGESESYENPPTQKGLLARSGEYWTVGYGAATFSLKDIKGLGYIERLLQHPGEEFHALDLMSGPGARTDSESAAVEERESRSDPNLSIGRPGDAGEVLDPQATRDYKRRILELNEELEDLRERGNVERAEEVKSERDFLAGELGRGMGLGGRVRRTGSVSERARLSVTRAIKAALQKISERHAALGELLDHTIRTGTFCSYVPSPRVPVSWQFTLEGLKPSVGTEAPPPLFFRNETSFLRTLADQTTFVGREAERATLRRGLEQALDRKAKVVMIGGAPGVGKTRIAREIGAEASERGFRVLAGSCYDRDDSVPFMPVVEILEAALAQATSPQAFREGLGNDAAEIARLMPQLRRIFTDIPPPLELSPEQSRRILFSAIAELLGRTAGNRPVLLLLEDLHWADEGTLSLLNYFVRSVSTVPVMIVGTYRDHELDPAGLLARTIDDLIRLHLVEQIGLRGLPQDAVAEMIRSLSGREPPETVVSLFYSNTEGNPFFIEELYQHLVERAGLLDSNGEFRRDLKRMEVHVPPSLRLVIGRRLARLSDETQKILGTAAVIGRSFTFELLEASTAADPDSLLDRVEEAERAGLISSTVRYPEALFSFSHELIRKAVSEDLSVPRRQRLHLKIADAIERLHADALEDHANDLAHHLWEAGDAANPGETVHYLAMAAKRALAQSAYESALRHLQSAVELFPKLPDSKERAELELGLQINHGVALLATRGWWVPEAGNAYKRARELCSGEDPRLFSVLFGLWSFHLVLGKHPMSRSYAEEMIQTAARMADDGMLVQAQWASGCSQFFMGEFAGAHASFEQGICHYDREKHRALALTFGQDPCVSCLCYDAATLWMLGYPDQAEKRATDSLALARELGYRFTLTWCAQNLAMYHLIRHDFPSAEEMIREGLVLAREHGFAFFKEVLITYRAIGLAAQGKVDRHTESGGSALEYSGAGYELSHTWARSVTAEALAIFGQFDRALALVTQAAELVERNKEGYVESEIFRIKGELILRQIAGRPCTPAEIQSAESAATQSFLKAIEIARLRAAKMLEIRAAISLGRLLIRSGKQAEARPILKETYGWFTEGFNTDELKTAKSLLEET